MTNMKVIREYKDPKGTVKLIDMGDSYIVRVKTTNYRSRSTYNNILDAHEHFERKLDIMLRY